MPENRTLPVSNENVQGGVVVPEKAPAYYPNMIPDYGPEVVYQDRKNPSNLPQVIQQSDTDKIVLHGKNADSPQVTYAHSPLYVQSDEAGLEHNHGGSEAGGDKVTKDTRRKRIWGLRPLTFWLLVLFAIVLIGGAVAGGVSGSLIRKRKTEVASPVVTTGATTTKHSESATTTTPSPSATLTDYAAEINYSLQVFEDKNFQGRSHRIKAVGTYKAAFRIRSYIWQPGTWNTLERKFCTEALCLGDHKTGWRGKTATEETGEAWEPQDFPDSMIVVCGSEFWEGIVCPENPDVYQYMTPVVSPPSTKTTVRIAGTTTPEAER